MKGGVPGELARWGVAWGIARGSAREKLSSPGAQSVRSGRAGSNTIAT